VNFWDELIKIVISYGVFAVLFVFLFFYQLKDSARREKEYQKTIGELTEHLKVIEDVKEEVGELKEYIKEGERYEE
jgi:hypothetical protein